MHALLGFEPDAANKRLCLRPQLPDWLGEVELGNIRVGNSWVDLRISRDRVVVEGQRGEELDVKTASAREPNVER